MTEKITKEYLASLMQVRRPLILDIGCYDARDSIELSKLLPGAIFHCFEPDPRSIAMAMNAGAGDNFFLHDVALCAVDAAIDFHQSDSETHRNRPGQTSWPASGSIRKPKEHLTLFPEVEFKKVIKVKGVRLDTWYRQYLWPLIIDLAWVDVNGAEEDLLLGGVSTFRNNVRYLHIEFAEKELYEGQINREKLLGMLPDFEVMGEYDFHGNFGNLLLNNKILQS